MLINGLYYVMYGPYRLTRVIHHWILLLKFREELMHLHCYTQTVEFYSLKTPEELNLLTRLLSHGISLILI